GRSYDAPSFCCTGFNHKIISVTSHCNGRKRGGEGRGAAYSQNVVMRICAATDVGQHQIRHSAGGIGQRDIPEIYARVVSAITTGTIDLRIEIVGRTVTTTHDERHAAA